MKFLAIMVLACAALIAAPGCASKQQSSVEPISSAPDHWPKTVNQAVAKLIKELPDSEKQQIRTTAKQDLIEYHFSLGLYIRNNYGLWRGNRALMTDCHATEPDGASMVIIEALWQKLQNE